MKFYTVVLNIVVPTSYFSGILGINTEYYSIFWSKKNHTNKNGDSYMHTGT